MKKLFIVLIVVSFLPCLAQQTKFIIGAEHVSLFHDFTLEIFSDNLA